MEPLYLWKKFHKAFVGFLSNQHIKRENLPLDCETDSEFQSVRPWSFDFADLVLVLRPFITKWVCGEENPSPCGVQEARRQRKEMTRVPIFPSAACSQWSNFLQWSQASQSFHQVPITNKPLTNPLFYEPLGALKTQHVIPCFTIHLIIRNKFCFVFNIIASLSSYRFLLTQ